MLVEIITEKVKIENVQTGSIIKCYDLELDCIDYQMVQETHKPIVKKENQVKITSNSSSFITSDWHPTLLYKDKKLQYVRADEICIGDFLISDDGEKSLVTDIEYDDLADEQFYDLTVETHHNYFVSMQENLPAFVIHNTMGLADHLAKRDIPFSKSKEMVSELFENIAFYTINASVELAKDRGCYPKYEGSDWSKGLILSRLFYKNQYIEYEKLSEFFSDEEIKEFANDEIKLQKLFESFGSGKFKDLKATSTTKDWSDTRKKLIKYGIRNSHLQMIAPNCQDPNNKIRTVNGIKSIYEILDDQGFDITRIESNEPHWINLETPIEVDTLNGVDVCERIWFNGKQDTISIEFEDGNIYTYTPNHKLLVSRIDGTTEWVRVDELQENDEIVNQDEIGR